MSVRFAQGRLRWTSHRLFHTRSRYTAAHNLCPSCSRPLPSFLHACPACSSISSPAPNVSHHALFGLPYEPNPFTIDLATLKQRFRQAQAACHPDAWTSKGPVGTPSTWLSCIRPCLSTNEILRRVSQHRSTKLTRLYFDHCHVPSTSSVRTTCLFRSRTKLPTRPS